jgi:glycosyltransferase involved in cell wall biosynthesis
MRLPVVITFHSVLTRSPSMFRFADRVLGWSRWPIVVTAVSEIVAAGVQRCAPHLQVDDLPNGIDPAIWRPRHPRPQRSSAIIKVVTAMRLNRIKRPIALLQAFRHAKSVAEGEGRRLTLEIAGEGPCRHQVERFVRRHSLKDCVTLHGALPRSSLSDLYANADIFLLASRREAFGIAALEARLAGLSVIAMAGAGTTRFLRHGETALLANNDAELAAHVALAALDDELRRKLTSDDPSLARYSWNHVLNEHLACYDRAIRLTNASGIVASTLESGAESTQEALAYLDDFGHCGVGRSV